ncbi:hypothetical protein [Paenibacillus sp. YIM B09110]
MKQYRYLDYAVYGNVIVPLLMFNAEVWFQIDDDSEVGKCRIVSRQRKKK